ncbi:MAG: hypothetical protein VXY77_04445 [Pseudomonadota bacterium]|nr:hypothetical protein [Pseudomonadota bacterium]
MQAKYHLFSALWMLSVGILTFLGYYYLGAWAYTVIGKPHLNAAESKQLARLLSQPEVFENIIKQQIHKQPSDGFSKKLLQALIQAKHGNITP